MKDFWTIIIIFTSGSFITMLGVFLGSWVMFKGQSAVPNESFIGRSPKGDAFTISDGLDEPEFPDEPGEDEKKVLERTNDFLRSLGV